MVGNIAGHVRGHATLLFLTFIIVIHAVDRLAIVILLEDIKQDLGLSDAQLGLLSGFAFVALYVLVGIPMAYISDRSNRSRMIGVALIAWGGMTMLCGLAQNFVQLVAARCGVGIGASPCVPAAHSIIADIYPPSQRTTALSITESGFFVGAFIGLWLCGWLATDYGWRVALIAVGIFPALLGFAVIARMRDPARTAPERPQGIGLARAIGTIVGVPAVRWYVAGSALAVFAGAGMMTWLPTLMIRSYAMPRAEAGGIIGGINGAGGLILTILVGIAADRLARRDGRWNLWIPMILFAVSAPFALFGFLSQSATVILICFALSASCISACTAPVISHTQQIMPSHVHAMVTAVIFLVFNIVGFGIGPLVVGALSDHLAATEGPRWALQHALLYICAPSLVLASILIAVGACLSDRPERASC